MKYPSDWNDEIAKKPICGVLSVAIIGNTTFANATRLVKENMLPHQKRHGGKTYHQQRIDCLSDLGINFREIPVEGRRTLSNVIAFSCRPNKTYMITTSTHVVTVRDRLVADQKEICSIDSHNSRRCVVRNIVEIL